MIHTIENDYLRVSVDDHGAELCSIFDKIHNREVIWQADPAYWKRHAPVLFPNVGRHFEDHYRINGVEYPSSQHGFARDSEFTCVDMTADSITHRLKSSDATRENYPYDFELKIKHVLIDISSGTAVADKAYTLELENGSCLIDAHMFDKDALIFDDQIEKAGIAFPDGTPYVELICHGFPSFGIWSVPGSPFVCLEPWMGRCDDFGFKGELPEKKYINTLDKNEIFTASYEIKIY